jgi:hypothetical protein
MPREPCFRPEIINKEDAMYAARDSMFPSRDSLFRSFVAAVIVGAGVTTAILAHELKGVLKPKISSGYELAVPQHPSLP